MNNKRIGNGFENDLAKILFLRGFWAHVMASKSAGQPADIFAAKNGHSFLIDAKVCSDDVFDTSRIEENQRNAMDLWEKCGNGFGYFALRMSDETIYMLDHNTALFHRKNKITLNRKEIESCCYKLDEWEKRVMM